MGFEGPIYVVIPVREKRKNVYVVWDRRFNCPVEGSYKSYSEADEVARRFNSKEPRL